MDDNIRKAIGEVSSDDINAFIDNYRNALGEQYNADVANLNNQRNLDYTTIMSNANVRGMLHSTFPGRDKLKYDVSTYEPNLIKARQSYQTGLDKLYSNVGSYYNNIKNIKEKIADLNSSSTQSSGNLGTASSIPSTQSSGANVNEGTGTTPNFQFTDDQGNPITYYTYAQRAGDNGSYLQYMADQGDVNAQRAVAGLQNANKQLTSEERRAFQILGIPTTGYGTRA